MKNNKLGRRSILTGATATAALMGAVRTSFPSGAFAQATGPETNKVTLGFIALTDASPLIIAKEKKLFDKYGITDANVAKQASWGTTRDNIVLGANAGGIDGAPAWTAGVHGGTARLPDARGVDPPADGTIPAHSAAPMNTARRVRIGIRYRPPRDCQPRLNPSRHEISLTGGPPQVERHPPCSQSQSELRPCPLPPEPHPLWLPDRLRTRDARDERRLFLAVDVHAHDQIARRDVARSLHPDPLGRTGWLLSFSSGQAF